jgi:aquaporin Z
MAWIRKIASILVADVVGYSRLAGVIHPLAPTGFAGLAIGLTLAALLLFGIDIDGASLNPARSIGPALVGIGSNPGAVAQLWLFIIAPLIGAGAAGFVCRTGALFDAPKKA